MCFPVDGGGAGRRDRPAAVEFSRPAQVAGLESGHGARGAEPATGVDFPSRGCATTSSARAAARGRRAAPPPRLHRARGACCRACGRSLESVTYPRPCASAFRDLLAGCPLGALIVVGLPRRSRTPRMPRRSRGGLDASRERSHAGERPAARSFDGLLESLGRSWTNAQARGRATARFASPCAAPLLPFRASHSLACDLPSLPRDIDSFEGGRT